MKFRFVLAMLTASTMVVAGLVGQTYALGTAFTYQGQLLLDGSPTTGTCDFQFSLFDAASGPSQLGSTQPVSPVSVANGLFTVELNNTGQFGASAFNGGDRWLQIAVRCPVGSGSYTTLNPRQQLTATPYALYAPTAGSAGGLTCSGCVGTTNLAASAVTDQSVASGISYSKLSGAPTTLPPSGAAGGSLSGTYPNPSIAAGVVTGANVADGSLTTTDIDFTTGNINLANSTAGAGNVLKDGLPFIQNFGTSNTFIGVNAGNFSTTGFRNAALGVSALSSNSSGVDNTALGDGALRGNAAGVSDTAVGSSALAQNTTGNGNTAVGWLALNANTTASANTAVGAGALQANTTGDGNTAVGVNALVRNTTARNNTALGSAALANTTAPNNTGVGYLALVANTTGDGNTAVGVSALASNTGGISNVALGASALLSNTTGGSNTAIGAGALSANTTGLSNTALGWGALSQNMADGSTAVGQGALQSNTTGEGNIAFGQRALNANTTGNANTAVGQGALQASNGAQNTAVGARALDENTTGGQNTAVGLSALSNNSTGTFNTVLGWQAMVVNSTANYNTAVGAAALGQSTGEANVALGVGAGLKLTTGSSNIYIGNSGGGGESNTIRIGGGANCNPDRDILCPPVQTATYIAGINGATSASGVSVLVNANGQLGTTTSSARFKDDIQDIGNASDGLMQLHPVRFRYKPDVDPSGLEQYGLVAEEVAKVYPDLVVYDDNGQPQTVRYHFVNAMLLNEVQKQARQIREQQEHIATLTARLERLEAVIDAPVHTQAPHSVADRSRVPEVTANPF